MEQRATTRRGVLLSLGGLTTGALGPAIVGGAHTTVVSQTEETIPPFTPAVDGEYSIEGATAGWGVGAATGASIDTEQAARTTTNRATAHATASSQSTGEFAQTAVIGTPVPIRTEQQISLTLVFDGQYWGALRAGEGSSVTVELRYGVGLYDDMREAVLGLGGPPTFSGAAVYEYTLFDQTVSDGEGVISTPTATETLSVSIPETETYMAYARLTTSGDVGEGSTATVDFGPDGPALTEPTSPNQLKGFVFERVRFQAD